MNTDEIVDMISDINHEIPERFINNGICLDYMSNGNCECIKFLNSFLWDSENGYSYDNYKYNEIDEEHYNPNKEILMQIMCDLISDLKNIFGERDDGDKSFEDESLFSWPNNRH